MLPDLADVLGVPDTFEYEGKSYKVRELTLIQRARFGQWLKDRAKQEVARTLEAPDEFKRQAISAVYADIAAGVYSWGSEASIKALCTPEGCAYALYLALSEDHPEVDEELAAKMFEAKLNELAEKVLRAASDPKASSGTGGSPPGRTSSRSSGTGTAGRSKKSRGSRRRR